MTRCLLAGLLWCSALVATTSASAASGGDVVTSLNDQQPIDPRDKRVKQLHLGPSVVGSHTPGKPFTEVGYPKQPRVRGMAAKKLKPDKDDEPSDHLAHKKVYPNNHIHPTAGVMTAEDIRELMSEVDPYLDNIKAAKIKEREYDEAHESIRQFAMKALADKISGGVVGEELLSGAIGNQLGMMRGNLGNCQKKLAKCKSSRELGEEQSPEEMDPTSPKHTAIEEDRIRRGQEDPAAEIKAKPPTEYEKHTASEDYVNAQRGSFWKKLPNEPGFKMTYDRMTEDELKNLVKQTRSSIIKSKHLEKIEMAVGYRKIDEANKKAMDAMLDASRSKRLMDESEKVSTTAEILQQMKETQDEVVKCIGELKDECNVEFQLAEPAAPMHRTPGSLDSDEKVMPHPNDKPDGHTVLERPGPTAEETNAKNDRGDSAHPHD